MCACANKGEKFSDRTRGEIEQGGNCLIFLENQKLVEHRVLRVHTFGESCTGKGEMHSVGVSVFYSWFSLRFWHDCVEPCLCL